MLIYLLLWLLSCVWLFSTPWTEHISLLCPSLFPRVCSNSCPLSWWWYLTFSSSSTLFSFCLQSLPAWGSFPMSWFFTSSGQRTGTFDSLVAQMVKNPPVEWETQVKSLGQEAPWRREWQPTAIFLPGESHGQRSLVGYSLWGRKESAMTELQHFNFQPSLWFNSVIHIWLNSFDYTDLCQQSDISAFQYTI